MSAFNFIIPQVGSFSFHKLGTQKHIIILAIIQKQKNLQYFRPFKTLLLDLGIGKWCISDREWFCS